jgi:hypothetical protein
MILVRRPVVRTSRIEAENPILSLADGLPRRPKAVKLLSMKRQLIALVVMLAIGLHGTMTAFAATSPLMPIDCQLAAIAHADAIQDSCCPKGQHAMSCCLDLCLSTAGVTESPAALTWFARSAPALPDHTSIFSSRGDSPLIRPPIF